MAAARLPAIATSARSGSGEMPLPLSTKLHPDESLPGFIIRLAKRSRAVFADRLAARAGLRQPGAATSAADLSRLARMAGVDVERLDRVAYRPTGRLAHHRFIGGELHREFIDISSRRACPLCLRDSAHHRAAWDFALLTACPTHGSRLLARCPACPRKPGWRYPSVARCRCGASLSSSEASPAAPAEIEANRRGLALASDGDVAWLPECLRACERADLVRIMMCLGMFLSGWSGQRRIESLVARGPDTVAQVLMAGVQCLADWPRSLHEFLAACREGEGGRRGRYGARKALGSFYDWLHVLEPTTVRAALIEAARDFVAADDTLAARAHRSSLVAPVGGRAEIGSASLTEAAAALGRSGHGVKRLMTAGLIPTAASEGRGVPMDLDRAAVLELAGRAQAWLSLRELAVVLGVSRARTERIVQAGLLRSVHAPSDGWATWSFEASEVDALLAQMSQVTQVPGPQVGFDFAAEAFRRRGVDIAGLLTRIADGRLAVAELDPDSIGLKRLRFGKADIRAACRELECGSGERMTVQAAAERLGLKWAVVDNLVRRGMLGSAPGGILAAEVERFQREYVLGSELARRAETSPRQVAKVLAEAEVAPVVGPTVDESRQNVFRREEAEAVLRHAAHRLTAKVGRR